ncbi:MAG: transposase [Deltaproteobacteria bacterium]|nr:transposase [Deltaproteobacteria bacterium]
MLVIRSDTLHTQRLAATSRCPIGKVARELDIHPNLLHTWRRKFLKEGDKAFVGKGRVTPEGAEIRRIKKQLPTVVPTMTEWGMIIFMLFAGLGAAYNLRRQKRVRS